MHVADTDVNLEKKLLFVDLFRKSLKDLDS